MRSERAERLAVVSAMIYLVFNEGYSASRSEAARPCALHATRRSGSRGLLLHLFPAEPEIMGLRR